MALEKRRFSGHGLLVNRGGFLSSPLRGHRSNRPRTCRENAISQRSRVRLCHARLPRRLLSPHPNHPWADSL